MKILKGAGLNRRPPLTLLMLLICLACVLAACAAPPAPPPSKPSLGNAAVAPAFNLYADGSVVQLDLPASVSADAAWTLEPALGQVRGQGRSGQYVLPANLSSEQTITLHFIDTRAAGTFDHFLKVRLVPASLRSQADPVGPTGSTYCAGEGKLCQFSGTKVVAYGLNGSYFYRAATGSVQCNNLVFNDPLFGTIKSCFVLDQAVPVGPAGTVFCALDGQTCGFNNPHQVSYGQNGSFKMITAPTSVQCVASAFSDPVGSANKACFVSLDSNVPIGPESYLFCARDGERCNYSGTRSVAYGAAGKFEYKRLAQGTDCNSTVFPDPIPGTAKACFVGPKGVTGPAPKGPAGYTFCSVEGIRCEFTGSRKVAFGTDPNYVYKTLDGSTDCTTAVFGEPAAGLPKACFLEDVPDPGGNDEPVEAVIDTAAVAPAVFQGGDAIFSALESTGNDLRFLWNFGDGSATEGNLDEAGSVAH